MLTSDELGKLYADRRQALFNFALAKTGSTADAEEIVQDAFAQLQRASASQEIKAPEAMLFRIVRNLVIDRYRQAKARRKREEAWAGLEIAGGASRGEPVSAQPLPDRAAEAREELERVVKALETLSPNVRKAFILHKFKGLTHREVAAALGLSQSTIEKHIMAAMRCILATDGK